MPDPVEPRLAALPTLSKAALGDLWKDFFCSTPPTQLRRHLMIPILAYRIQEQTFGSLSARAQHDFATSVAHSKKEVIPPSLALHASAPEHDWFANGAIGFTW